MLRTISGIAAGIIVALAAMWVIGLAGNVVHPIPPGLRVNDAAGVGAYIASMPPAALLLVAAAWFFGALAGGVVAASFSRRRWTIWLVAAVVAFLAILNVLQVTHPLLLQIASVAAPLLGGLVASLAARRAGWDVEVGAVLPPAA